MYKKMHDLLSLKELHIKMVISKYHFRKLAFNLKYGIFKKESFRVKNRTIINSLWIRIKLKRTKIVLRYTLYVY